MLLVLPHSYFPFGTCWSSHKLLILCGTTVQVNVCLFRLPVLFCTKCMWVYRSIGGLGWDGVGFKLYMCKPFCTSFFFFFFFSEPLAGVCGFWGSAVWDQRLCCWVAKAGVRSTSVWFLLSITPTQHPVAWTAHWYVVVLLFCGFFSAKRKCFLWHCLTCCWAWLHQACFWE